MLDNKVLEWIKKTGFPLEMQAASAFRAAGFEIRQSYTYPDPQSDKGREIDVLAQDPDPNRIGIIEIFFVLECKASTKPWVVLTSENALANYNQIFAFAVTSEAASKVLADQIFDDLQIPSYLKRPSKCGYGFRQALGNNNDIAYGAAISAIKACRGITQDSLSSKIPRLSFAFPAIVVDSPLFECSLEDSGELRLQEVEESEFLCSAHIPDEAGCCIRIIKKENLPNFATKAKQLANEIRESLKKEESAALIRARALDK
jgi:hypothetical protein